MLRIVAPAPVLSLPKGRESEGVPQMQFYAPPCREGDSRKGFSDEFLGAATSQL